MLGMAKHIAATEGPLALYKGFWPAIHRQLVFASLRVGLYRKVCPKTPAAAQGFLEFCFESWMHAVSHCALCLSCASSPAMQISEQFRKPGEENISLSSRVMAGLVSGAIGISVANVGGRR